MNLSNKIVLIGNRTWNEYLTSLFLKTNGGKNRIFEFFDFTNEPENRELHPKLHHFRSSNISAITSQLEKQWKFIIENNIGIPTHEILLGNEDEIVRYVPTSFLSDNIFCDTRIPVVFHPESMLTNTKRRM